MAELEPVRGQSIQVSRDRPLIGIPTKEDGEEVISYFTDDDDAAAAASPAGVLRALSLLGSWNDIDTPDALDQLDRIRHESTPTPPINLGP